MGDANPETRQGARKPNSASSALCVSQRTTETGEGEAMNTMIWKCEQYVAGKLHEQTIFENEQQAREFARKLYDVRPDTILRIEPLPIQHVWN
jgi:hypothetical protein